MVYSAVFALYSVMEVLGLLPQEVRSAGVTLPALLKGYYGDEVCIQSQHTLRKVRIVDHNDLWCMFKWAESEHYALCIIM